MKRLTGQISADVTLCRDLEQTNKLLDTNDRLKRKVVVRPEEIQLDS